MHVIYKIMFHSLPFFNNNNRVNHKQVNKTRINLHDKLIDLIYLCIRICQYPLRIRKPVVAIQVSTLRKPFLITK